MNVRLDEKVIVITGSSRGLGSCLADAMAKEGAHMVINYNKSDCAAHNIAESIIGNGGDCLVIRADVSKEEEVEYLYSQVREHFGKVDVLINNAGICLDAPIVDMDVNDWCKVMDINLKGAYLCSHFFGRMMVEQNYGKIINIASIKGVEGCINQSNYCASKAAMISLTRTIAKELGKYNISSNAICPGFCVTDLNRNNKEKARIAKERSVMKMGDGLSDFINFTILLSSDLISGISGRVFYLDSRM